MKIAIPLVCIVLAFSAFNCQVEEVQEVVSKLPALLRGPPGWNVPPHPLPKICPRNEIYKECGSACANNCGDMACIAMCVSGCFCPDHMIRVEGKCIPRKPYCASLTTPTPTTTPQLCPGGQVWNECGSLCDNQCPGAICAQVCIAGCSCPIGMSWNDDQEECVYLECESSSPNVLSAVASAVTVTDLPQ